MAKIWQHFALFLWWKSDNASPQVRHQAFIVGIRQ